MARTKDSDTRDPSTDGLSATKIGQVRRNTDQATVAEWQQSVAPETYYEAAVILMGFMVASLVLRCQADGLRERGAERRRPAHGGLLLSFVSHRRR